MLSRLNAPSPESVRFVTSSPRKSIRPPVGLMSLSAALPSVVLPLPDSPTIASVSPDCTSSDTPSSAFTATEPISPFRAW